LLDDDVLGAEAAGIAIRIPPELALADACASLSAGRANRETIRPAKHNPFIESLSIFKNGWLIQRIGAPPIGRPGEQAATIPMVSMVSKGRDERMRPLHIRHSTFAVWAQVVLGSTNDSLTARKIAAEKGFLLPPSTAILHICTLRYCTSD